MDDEVAILANYKPSHLYTNPRPAGTYATIVGDSEEVILGEIDVTPRCKLAISAFYVTDKSDFGTFKLTKLQYHKTYGWRIAEQFQVNNFQLSQMQEFLSVIASLDFSEPRKARVSLTNLQLGAVGALLSSNTGASLVREIAKSPDLHKDIYAVAAKRAALQEFEHLLADNKIDEAAWQAFMDRNTWIFGHGLQYVFLNKVGQKLQASTTGSTFDRHGKIVDGLVRTKAEVSQFVLIEMKKNNTDLVQTSAYRKGCWGIDTEIADAVTQIQKTAFEFARDRFRVDMKDTEGNSTGEIAYVVEPKTYLVVGNLGQLKGNDDKVACFELFRRNIRSPEIITFDELYWRARCIVENVSAKVEGDNQPSYTRNSSAQSVV